MPRRNTQPEKPPCSVVGIGASAGGIEALQKLFKALPGDLGHAYVVIVHLSPDHASDLSGILARCTNMPVAEVVDTQDIEPNRVYVISPNRKLEITDSSIGATKFDEPHGQRTAIDVFFRSLAAKHGDGFAIILSGSGTDGALGARAVKEAGGLILVQDPEEAMHGSMPEAVIGTGVADVVADIEGLVERLVGLTRHKRALIPLLQRSKKGDALSEEEQRDLGKILDLLRSGTGHDFGEYKRSTVLRRMARRMQLVHVASFGEYLRHLDENREEISRLLDDLLITVTSFFRDPEAWEALREKVIVPLIESTKPDETIRAWVVGCATGEEAYSLAILFNEEMRRLDRPRKLIVFASDIDDESLAKARQGRYPAAIRADVSESRRERYFTRHGEVLHINEGIRNCVVFAQHSAFRDPPFSGMHLLTCRNLMIYLERQLQEQLQSIFRHACRDDGYLFLGSAESALSRLFKAVDKHHHIYGMGTRPPRLPQLGVPTHARLIQATPEIARRRSARARQSVDIAERHLDLIEKSAPPSILIDGEGRALHLSPSAGRYLQPRGGKVGSVIDDLLREELRGPARTALELALAGGTPTVSPAAAVHFNGAPRWVTMLVHPRPAGDSEDAVVLVMFFEAGDAPQDESGKGSGPDRRILGRLREQLRTAGRRIEAKDAQHDFTLQELRAANEELQSLNEEYRSTTEELETSKEELQSVNEELQTVNSELRIKLDESARARSDLENLLMATNVAILFLDRDLCIMRFTPQLTELFNLRDRDEGRPITDFTHNIEYGDLAGHARKVLADLKPVEYEAKARSGATLIVRIFPYRSADDRIDGVVLNFLDISKAKEAEAQLRANREQLETELEVTRRLHQVSMTVATADSQQEALDEVLAAAMDLMKADFGAIQIRDENSGRLHLAAHHGIRKSALPRWEEVTASDGSATVRAMQKLMPIQIPDIMEDDDSEADRDLAAGVGYRAVQTTPLIDHDGKVIGVLSSHYREPQAFTARHRQLAELLARQAAILIAGSNQERRLARLNEQLTEQAEELLEHDRAKEEFLNLLGHELRNPLAAIRNSLEAIEREEGPSLAGGNFRERALRIIDRQSRHMTRMVNDLLEISRINQGKLNLRLQSVDIRESVADAVATLAQDFLKKNLDTDLDLPDEPVYVRADPERAAQILDNVLRNAFQFTEAGGKIAVALKREAAHACIRIKDTGIGMEPEQIESLFEPYKQAAEGNPGSSGLGLGLSLCRKLMALHAGEITAHSEGPGHGSEFVLRLPLTNSRPGPVAPGQETLERLRVLVVDDDADNAASLAVLLDNLGQETAVAHDGETALEMAREFDPHLVFLDVAMPGMGGVEVAQRLRGDDFAARRMTLVGLSGHAPEEGSTAFDRYILKPATLDDILDALNSAPAL